MTKSPSKGAQDNRANQLNPAHPAYYLSRGASPQEAQERAAHSTATLDNHANQLNPEHDTYWSSRSEPPRSGRSHKPR